MLFYYLSEIPIPKDTRFEKKKSDQKLNPKSWNTLDEEYYDCSDNVVLLVLDFIKNNTKYFD